VSVCGERWYRHLACHIYRMHALTILPIPDVRLTLVSVHTTLDVYLDPWTSGLRGRSTDKLLNLGLHSHSGR